MLRLAKRRLQPFGERADVVQTAGTARIKAVDSTFVFDLLSDDDTRVVVSEARLLLKPDGLLGLVSLTSGPMPLSWLVTTAWRGLHRMSPLCVPKTSSALNW